MPFLADYILDSSLTLLATEGDRLDICSAEPTTYAQATSTLTLANKTGISIGAAADRSPNGRKVAVAAITSGAPGTVTANGTGTHWAISDTAGGGRLLATGALAASQVLTSGNALTVPAFDIGVPDAV